MLCIFNFFALTVAGYDVIRIQVNFSSSKNKGKVIYNSPKNIISGNFDSEKLSKMRFFTSDKDILHFFLNQDVLAPKLSFNFVFLCYDISGCL
jgi:hypothetical protein